MTTTTRKVDEQRSELLEELDSCLDRGRTLPARWYFDDDVLDLERQFVFRRTWQLVREVAPLDEPGDCLTDVVAGVPIVIVRGKDDELRGFVNVCRHRGHVVVGGCGNRTSLQCPYHAWTYGLDGQLRAAPRSDAEPGFDRGEHPLLPVQVAKWGPLLFANLDVAAPSFGDQFGELRAVARKRELELEGMTHRSAEAWDFAANWKVFYDNSAECYHCPTIHPTFAKGYGVGVEEYVLESHDAFVYHRSPVKQGGDESTTHDWEMYSAWPNWSIAIGGSSRVAFVYSFSPVDPGHAQIFTHVLADPKVSDEDAADEMEWWRHIVLDEDRLACESVQIGLGSNQIKDGPLLLNSEHIIQSFQSNLRSALRGSIGDTGGLAMQGLSSTG
jgi:choline monooxygenase